VSKPWYRSRMLWINLAAMLVAAAADNWSTLQPVLPAHWYAWFAFALPILNVALRAVTTQPIHWREPPDMGAGGKC
jgi:hypothetical protein